MPAGGRGWSPERRRLLREGVAALPTVGDVPEDSPLFAAAEKGEPHA